MTKLKLDFPAGVSIVEVAEDREALAANLAEQAAIWLGRALSKKERALLVVSGGRTPIPFFKLLAAKELDWSRVDITLADERWVDETHEDSNAALLREHLLQGHAAKARFLPLKMNTDSAKEATTKLDEQLADLAWPIDVLVLGMGNDGHTASLFPGTEGLPEAMTTGHRCAAVTPLEAPHERMTLSFSALAEAEHTALYVTGQDKAETLKEVLEDLADSDAMPVRAFIKPHLTIFWSA